MATAALDSTAASSSDSDRPLQLESIPTVDLRLLSQSELYFLSLCSDASFDLRRCDDVVIPKIDRSVFNESAGSRKQTYSRLRLAPAASSTSSPGIHRRTPHIRSPKPTSHASRKNDPEKAENNQIIGLFKELFSMENNSDGLVPIRVDYNETMPQLSNVGTTGGKRKRGRPRKNENVIVPVPVVENVKPLALAESAGDVMKDIVVYENVEDRDKEILNKEGVVVDLVALAGLDDPYGTELRRRTEGLGSEEQLLAFLNGLNGQWGSRRKKKRIVDANEFGDALPKGWKLVLAVKKKEGNVWLFCRRYISPNGRQFVSCKDISSYLLSILGIPDDYQPNFAHSINSTHVANTLASKNAADLSVQEESMKENLVCHSSTLFTGDTEKEVLLQTLKCQKCNMMFDQQDDLLHHQLSHRRKRSKVGTTITDGVIIKEGKYECQFCHKTFIERHRYNGHMGAHVRNHVKSVDASLPVNVGMNVADDNVVVDTFHATAREELAKFKPNSSTETYTDWFYDELNGLNLDKPDLKSDANEKPSGEELGDKHETVMKTCNDVETMDVTKDIKTSQCIGSGINEFSVGHEDGFGNHSSLFLNEQTFDVQNNAVGVSERGEPNQEAIFDSDLFTTNLFYF